MTKPTESELCAALDDSAFLVGTAALMIGGEAVDRAARHMNEVRALLDRADWKASQRRFLAEPEAPTNWGRI